VLSLGHGHGELGGRPSVVVLHGSAQAVLERHFPYRPLMVAWLGRHPGDLVGTFPWRGKKTSG